MVYIIMAKTTILKWIFEQKSINWGDIVPDCSNNQLLKIGHNILCKVIQILKQTEIFKIIRYIIIKM